MAGFKKKQIKVIAGTLRGRALSYPAAAALRPTMQRTRASVFDSLGPALAGSVFFDLYAAGGAVGIEALSRGAEFVHFVERDRRALESLKDNLASCGIERDRFRIHSRAVIDFLRGEAVVFGDGTIVYADPPYDSGDVSLLVEFFGSIDYPSDAVLVVEHRRDAVVPDAYGRLVRTKLKRFGQSWVSFFALARGETR
ncbi:MAG: RsmD family RNA methyltransferase [bacterium]